jgi:hypothetical protein
VNLKPHRQESYLGPLPSPRQDPAVSLRRKFGERG